MPLDPLAQPFTGAVQDRAGKFEQADGGTIFLDEIGDMSLAAQAKVLRVLQEGEVTRIGGQKTRKVEVRVLAATNKRLEDEIAVGRFREDLYYRLNVVPIVVPPLRERREDIPMLVQHFMARLAAETGMSARAIAPEAVERLSALDWPGNVRELRNTVERLAAHDWPGNIRELRNTVERLLILAAGPRVLLGDVERLVGGRASETAGAAGLGGLEHLETYEQFKLAAERAFLLVKLRQYDWNVAETARALDMPRSNLYKKIERHGLAREH